MGIEDRRAEPAEEGHDVHHQEFSQGIAGAALAAALLMGGLAGPASGASDVVSAVPLSHDDQSTEVRARLATSTDSWAAAILRQVRVEKSKAWIEEQARHARLARSTDAWAASLLKQQQMERSTDSWAADLLRRERAGTGGE